MLEALVAQSQHVVDPERPDSSARSWMVPDVGGNVGQIPDFSTAGTLTGYRTFVSIEMLFLIKIPSQDVCCCSV